MKPAEKIEGGGRKALAYNQATQMVVHDSDAEREKRIPYIRSETEKSKKPEICPKRRGPATMGLGPTWV
jgi:hypothetical protein